MAEYIDREELKKAIDTWDRFYYVPLQGVKRGRNDDYTALVRIDDILHCIDNMGIKSTDVQPVRHGRWIDNVYKYVKSLDAYFIQAKCSVCGRYSDRIDIYSRFMSNECCSRCGARMDGDTNG